MPTLGRHLVWGDTGSLLRPGVGDSVATSLMLGPEFTATPDVFARVRLDLFWPDVRAATITRLDADGTTSPVRNAEPLLLCTAATLYDHEAPLDRACTYRVAPYTDSTVYWDTDPVTISSTTPLLSWLKHPFKPSLSRLVHLHVIGPRQLSARRGVARPIDRPDPVVVYQTRSTDRGAIVVQTDGTWAENDGIRSLLADGAPLLLQQPAALGEAQLYVSVDTAELALPDDGLGLLFQRNITLPFDVVARPSGKAAGPAGLTYAAIAAARLTYEHVAAAEPTYTDLSIA